MSSAFSNQKRKNVLLLANTSWYLYNFRISLIDKLVSENYNVILVAPIDGIYYLS